MENKILVIDIETLGGFVPSKGFIAEIGIVELDIKTGETKTLFDSLCKHPKMTAKLHDSWIFQNSTMTIQDVRNAPFLSEIQEEVQGIIDKYQLGVTAYNRKFDITYMEGYGFTFKKLQPCPMLELTPIAKIPHKNGKGNKWPSCEQAWEFLFPNVEYIELHRGADDALHEAKIIFEMIKKGYYKLN